MNKLGHILPLALFFAVAGGEASATIKFDVSHTANKAQETVSEWAKQAQTAFEESTTIQTMIAYGKGVAEMAKWVKEQKALVDQTISDTVGAVIGRFVTFRAVGRGHCHRWTSRGQNILSPAYENGNDKHHPKGPPS